MSTSDKLLKIKRERENSKEESSPKKRQKSGKIINKEKNEADSIDDDIDEENFEGQKHGKSLDILTRNFLKYIKQKGRINININDIVKDLPIKKRRLYDITNVLQGIGYIKKKGKNQISWTSNYKNQNMSNLNSNSNSNSLEENYIEKYKKLKNEIDDLKREEKENEDKLNKFQEEFNILSKRQDFPKYGYVTFNDISNLSKNDNLDFMIIKAKKGTVINVIDDEESKKAYSKIENQMKNGKILKNEQLLFTLKNAHHIFFSNKNEKLKIYRVYNGKIIESIKNYQNRGENSDNKNKSLIRDLIQNNHNKNYNEEANKKNNISLVKNKYNLNIKGIANQNMINNEQSNCLNNINNII